MKIYAPDYYKDFSCLADKCKHSCCIGWEIDIDDETLEYYGKLSGPFGEKLRTGVDFNKGCFRLCEKDRCPFLNEKGLCEIILNLGKKGLCQICEDHPRFRNFFSGREELGLGLCCEATAKLILDKESKTELVTILDGEEETDIHPLEKDFLALRNRVFKTLQNRDQPISHRIGKMLYYCDSSFPKCNETEIANFFLGLERLNEEWTEVLKNINDGDFLFDIGDVKAEQLLFYFAFRHLSTALDEGKLSERAAFVALSYFIVVAAAKQVGIYEAARLYSLEIEYSDENTDAVLNFLSTKLEEYYDKQRNG